MTTTLPISREAARRRLAGLVGQHSWQVRLGHGTSATLDFGDRLPPLGPGRVERGSIHLWICGAMWRVERNSMLIAGSLDTGSVMAEALSSLAEVPVVAVRLPPSTLDLEIAFEEGLMLRTFRCDTDDDAWRFYSGASSIWLDPSGALVQRPQ